MKLFTDLRFWAALALVALAVGLHLAGFGEVLSIESLRLHRQWLSRLVAEHAFLAALAFLGVYVVVVALSLPGGLVLSLAGGFLFGPWLGTALNVTGATVGAVLVFLFARKLFGPDALARFGSGAAKLGDNIRANAWSYLLVLRLAPLFPFFLVNLVPAFVGVKLPVFALTTLFGIIPATAVIATAGAGLGSVLDKGGEFHISSVFTPQIMLGLFGLAALSLAAIPLKKRFG